MVFREGPVASAEYVELDLPTRNTEAWFDDLATQVNDPPKLRPEGLALKDGKLYVSGDWNETQNQVGVYTAAADGALTYDSEIQMPIPDPPPGFPNNVMWGPEGMTFNTSGTGYGNGGQVLVTVEDNQAGILGNTRALLDPATGVLSSAGVFPTPDDIAYGPASLRFYLLIDPNVLRVYLRNLSFTGTQFAVITRSKGVAVASPEFAQLLLNDGTITQEVLVVVAKSDAFSQSAPNNRLAVYSLAGVKLAEQDLLWLRDAFPGQPIQEYEAVTIDDVNNVIYIGDEKAGGVLVLKLPGQAAPLEFTTPPILPDAVLGEFYTQTITATGGVPPYTFSLQTGTLPAELSLLTDGTLSGAPAECGDFGFTIEVSDSDSPANTAAQAFSLSVSYAGIPGDLTQDGVVDGDDVAGFVAAMLGTGDAGSECIADFNGDLIVDDADMPLFIGVLLGT